MSLVKMVTENGEEHGLINVLPNSVRNTGFKHMSPETKKEAEALRKDDARMVKARYINHRGMHERLDKSYMHWEGDPIQQYHLIPGYVYDLPYGMVKEVNGSRGLEQRGQQIINGKYVEKDMSPIKLHELVPISF